MKKATPEVRLERILESLSSELATTSDAEILEACADLGIQPQMKGTAVFVGLKGLVFPYRPWALPPSNDPALPVDPDDPPDLWPRQ